MQRERKERNVPLIVGAVAGIAYIGIQLWTKYRKNVVSVTMDATEQTNNDDIALICKNNIPGWDAIHQSDIHVKPLTGGLTNILYLVTAKHLDISSVVVRIYGEGTEDIIDSKTERYIAKELGQRGLGPKIFHEFSCGKGRIEQFLPGNVLKMEEMMVPEYAMLIADFMADTHKLEMSLDKTPLCFNLIDKYYAGALKIDLSHDQQKQDILISFFLNSEEFKTELAWLKNFCASFQSPVVFCHNDINEGNIIASRHNNKLSFTVIDYEYASYNYRAYDIANYMCECYIKNNEEKTPGFSVQTDVFPTKEFRHQFLTRYLTKLGSTTTVQDLDDEVCAFMLASHIIWFLWAVMQSKVTSIEWGFIEYAEARYSQYKRGKNLILKSYTSQKEEKNT